MKKIRCAIYTRKSSEEGLELEFNSLDAQRDAGEAYIRSQKHEGWELIQKQYNDGGFSGGNMERPAFKELLEDIKAEKIDIVVVYKVDRLTRSLMDFAKIIEVFDAHNASFVSITQQFNTTTSMGRLTLNMLLSFAQFEREITSERLRDKFEATRQKGMYVGGNPAIGYKKENKCLVEDFKNAETIRLIFAKYLEFGSVKILQNYLREMDVQTPRGKNFTYGHLCRILRHKLYIGKLEYKGKVYDGIHKPIVDPYVFEEVQKLMDENKLERKFETNNPSYALLQGKLFDDKGTRMSPSYSTHSKNRRFRYYVSQAILKNIPEKVGTVNKVSGLEIESTVRKLVIDYLKDSQKIQSILRDLPVTKQNKILKMLTKLEVNDRIIRLILNKVVIYKKHIEWSFKKNVLIEVLEKLADKEDLRVNVDDAEFIEFKHNIVIAQTKKRGNKIILQGDTDFNETLIQAIVKAFYYHELREKNMLTREQSSSSYVRRIMNLRFLPPSLIEDILYGKQDPNLMIADLYKLVKV